MTSPAPSPRPPTLFGRLRPLEEKKVWLREKKQDNVGRTEHVVHEDREERCPIRNVLSREA